MDIEFQTIEMNPQTIDITFDWFTCSLNEWFLYKNPSVMKNMLPWDVWVMWI